MPDTLKRVWLVSACLLGHSCRYDGGTASPAAQRNLLPIVGDTLIPVCPEMLGGLPAPRVPAHVEAGTGDDVLDGRGVVRNQEGLDISAYFIAGAQKARDIGRNTGATHACLKARSPSCGVGQIHGPDGLITGDGVAAAELKRVGLQVCSDESLATFLTREPTLPKSTREN